MTNWFKSGCPNCGYKSSGPTPLGGWFRVYECNNCGKTFCYKCAEYSKNCPNCSSNNKKEIGQVPPP